MKVLPLKNLFLSNASLKIISLFLGYSFWYIASINQIICTHFSVPLYFCPDTTQYVIEAPETIDITLQGRRTDLYALDKESLAVHINISKLLPGKHGIIVKEHHLFLPHTISLVAYKPSNLSITIIEKQKA